MKQNKGKQFVCGVCNGQGVIDNQRCIYCNDRGVYGSPDEKTEDIEIVDLGEF